jgi:hypothetical protein
LLKPRLIHLHTAMLIDDPVVTWPELGPTEIVDAEEELKTYELHGLGVLGLANGPCVVSIPEGSDHALYLLEQELFGNSDVLCISIRRGQGLHVSWWARLEALANENKVCLADHRRHEVLSTVAYRLFKDGLRMIEDCADLVRGEGVDPSPEAMRTEKALTKAIESLHATGFRAPKTR